MKTYDIVIVGGGPAGLAAAVAAIALALTSCALPIVIPSFAIKSYHNVCFN